MRILLACHRFPSPPRHGAAIRPYHVLRHLARAHEVTLASLVRNDEEERGAAGLRAEGVRVLAPRVGELGSRWRALLRVPGRQPSSMGYFHAPGLVAALRAEIESRRYDLIVAHCSSVAPWVAGVAGVPRMLDFGDVDSRKWLAYARHRRFPLSLGYALEGRKLERAERALAADFDLCTCATPRELDSLRRLTGVERAGWFPNGVDGERLAPTDQPHEPETLCFLGRMDYYPNRECMLRFCAEVLPRLQQRRPGVRLRIVGAEPPRAVRRLARLPGVEVTGAVADVRPHLARAALSLAPLRIARGTQNKILESLALGVPVIASPLAARGVDALPGEHLLTAEDAGEWVEAIDRVLRDPHERRRLALAGRARVLSHHSWEGAMRRLDALIGECLATGGRRL